ncbi:MAG: hypothetical protein A2Y25_09900 [Candidatus Melainabacteria bacterium GWF2_37_15]|nr:MAG: hypothetical protein A2Y25_09900 [Candidatus Melainabacteria bacterium GWF2_37_15]
MVTPGLLKSIYIHVPFCKSKCSYCNFISFAGKENLVEKYFKALEQEITCNLSGLKTKFSTLYIGGGTPSIIDSAYYEKLLSLINMRNDAEITIEVNPGTVDGEYLKKLKEIGFNRLSIGVQCLDNSILKTLNRLHTVENTINTVKAAKESGFNNINIDLIYGLPGQTLSGWQKMLCQAIELDVQHISAYGLKIEEGTKFYRNPPQNLPDEDEVVQMYLKTIEILEQNDFKHYEISNFSKPGYESRHNLTYWNNEEYFGFGLSAHGYVDGVRYSNNQNLEKYIINPLKKESEKLLSEAERNEEAIFLGLRLRKGIDISESFYKRFGYIIEKYSSLGLMSMENNVLTLTPEGILLSNNILAEFIEE